jgi:NAD+ synthase
MQWRAPVAAAKGERGVAGLPARDPARAAQAIESFIRDAVRQRLRRHGAIVGLSGGVDSAVVAALCARALGPERVLAVLMPERDSSPDSLRLAELAAAAFGIPTLIEDIGPALEAIGCYRRQVDAIRQVVPAYGAGWRCKLSLPPLADGERLNVTRLTVESPAGERQTCRLTSTAYLELVAATNFKQRIRAALAYHHADRLRYAVAGTPNRLEYDQGFFVKQGDGAADFKPIAHLYKSEVYALAAHLGVPEEIRRRPPTTDTFSLEQTQDEFYFALPYAAMDVCLAAHADGTPAGEVARALGIAEEQVARVYRDIEAKRRATRYLHEPPLLLEPVLAEQEP